MGIVCPGFSDHFVNIQKPCSMFITNFLIQQLIVLAIGLSTTATGTMPKPRNPPAPKMSYIKTHSLQSQSDFEAYRSASTNQQT
jgi:hypothetical protein